MKKYGILTFHFCDNYGAVLQCYALRRYINSISGCQAEIINYNPGWKAKRYDDSVLQEKYLEKLEKYQKFNIEKNGISTDVITNLSDINQDEFEGFIVGSDQVWNVSFSSFRSAYLLDFASEEKKKISYAASVGMAADSPRMNEKIFAENIPRFDYLSVRERTHESFIARFTSKHVTTVLDPTMLLTSEDYDGLAEEADVEPYDDFIFFYYLKHDNTTPLACNFVNMLSRKYHLKIVHFYVEMPEQVFKNESRSFFFDGPKEFLWYVSHAKIVVTNSFHGTVFSILYHKPFYTYIVESMAARVLDLLSELKLSDRIIRGYQPLNEVSFAADFTEADEILERKRLHAKGFLQGALGAKD